MHPTEGCRRKSKKWVPQFVYHMIDHFWCNKILQTQTEGFFITSKTLSCLLFSPLFNVLHYGPLDGSKNGEKTFTFRHGLPDETWQEPSNTDPLSLIDQVVMSVVCTYHLWSAIFYLFLRLSSQWPTIVKTFLVARRCSATFTRIEITTRWRSTQLVKMN